MSTLILKRMPRSVRGLVERAAGVVAIASLLVWLWLGLPLLSQIGAATLTYAGVLTLCAALWRGGKKLNRKSNRKPHTTRGRRR